MSQSLYLSILQLIADTVAVDRKIRYRVSPKANIALKHLRAHLAEILALRFRGKELTERQQKWNELAMRVLGKMQSETSPDGKELGTIVH